MTERSSGPIGGSDKNPHRQERTNKSEDPAMRLKKLVGDELTAKLQPLAITEVPDLLGAIDDPRSRDATAKFLGVKREQVDQLHKRALSALTQEERQAYDEAHAATPTYGARNPDEV